MHTLFRPDAIRLILLVAPALFAISMHAAAAESVPLAIKGYDPVAYFTTGEPAAGCRTSNMNGMSTLFARRAS